MRDSIAIHDSNDQFQHFSNKVRVIIACAESYLVFPFFMLLVRDVVRDRIYLRSMIGKKITFQTTKYNYVFCREETKLFGEQSNTSGTLP